MNYLLIGVLCVLLFTWINCNPTEAVEGEEEECKVSPLHVIFFRDLGKAVWQINAFHTSPLYTRVCFTVMLFLTIMLFLHPLHPPSWAPGSQPANIPIHIQCSMRLLNYIINGSCDIGSKLEQCKNVRLWCWSHWGKFEAK